MDDTLLGDVSAFAETLREVIDGTMPVTPEMAGSVHALSMVVSELDTIIDNEAKRITDDLHP